MTIEEALSQAHVAHLDAEVLMAHVLEANRAFVMTHSSNELTEEQHRQFLSYIQRREHDEPLAYILNEKEFYGRSFFVDGRVLIPRPSTEELVKHALEFLERPRNGIHEIDSQIVAVTKVLRDTKPTVLVDIGTGSGCIGVTLALEGRTEKIIGVDISADALSVAKTNGVAWNTEIMWIESDGVAFIQKMKEPFVVVSNPPYIPDGMQLETNVADFEPHAALFAGIDGKSMITPLIDACEMNPVCTGYVFEMREDQV